MNRNRAYCRFQRERVIRRKEGILCARGGKEDWEAWTRGQRGRLSKGKIHCSCWMCRRKTDDEIAHRDAKRLCNGERW